MKKLLISGHRGLLGSACVRRFQDKYQVLTFEGDLTDLSLLRCWWTTNRPDYVIHCAAKVGGIKANRDFPVDFLVDNLKIQSAVIHACFDFDVEKLVFVGTSCLYPKNCPLPVTEESLLTGPFEPDVASYAAAKLAGYEMCRAYAHQYGKNFMTVAPCNLYGQGDNYGPSAHVIPALIKRVFECAKTKAPVVVWGDGSQVREFLYADDAADAISFVLEGWNKPDIINIGSGIGTSIRSLVETILLVSGVKVDVVWDRHAPTGIQNKTFKPDKLRHLGWGPEHDLKSGLAKTIMDYASTTKHRFK